MDTNQILINKVLEQIKDDVKMEDMTAIEELLQNVSPDLLQGYLSEINNE
jgi:hypothetical protein